MGHDGFGQSVRLLSLPRRRWMSMPWFRPIEPHDEALDFNRAMTGLIAELVGHIAELSHIDVARVCVAASVNRSRSRAGLLAYVVPLKYRGGRPIEVRTFRGKSYHWAMMPRPCPAGELLYFVYFLLPRFLGLSLREKIETVIHELYHIHPDFNGDLRRFPGRHAIHSSRHWYEQKVKSLAEQFFSASPDPDRYEFLRGDYRQTIRRYKRVIALHYPEPRPKLLKVEALP